MKVGSYPLLSNEIFLNRGNDKKGHKDQAGFVQSRRSMVFPRFRVNANILHRGDVIRSLVKINRCSESDNTSECLVSKPGVVTDFIGERAASNCRWRGWNLEMREDG